MALNGPNQGDVAISVEQAEIALQTVCATYEGLLPLRLPRSGLRRESLEEEQMAVTNDGAPSYVQDLRHLRDRAAPRPRRQAAGGVDGGASPSTNRIA